MKKIKWVQGIFILFCSFNAQSALHIQLKVNETLLLEKTAFALGVTPESVVIEPSDRVPESGSYFFNARYRDKLFQCYVATLYDQFVSDAVCRPTDGSDLPH
ncbi:hypothetical protein ACH7BS_24570 [Klebsiella aerogenes]|uniref:hypothetical protein n=1 Tax=Klebsiella aerogenes TaxID=548 RepID=UPI0037AED33D